MQVIDVDAELQPRAVKRTLSVEVDVLVAYVDGRSSSLIPETEFALEHLRHPQCDWQD
jgi:hypothetical protein